MTLETYAHLTTLYSACDRDYHNLHHINQMIRALGDDLTTELEEAVWFHDAIYIPGVSGCEEKSANLAFETCRISDEMRDAIIMTSRHTENLAGLTYKQALLLDADLSIFGQTSEVYRCYSDDIESEYVWGSYFSIQDYHAGRVRFLDRMLSKPKIYYSDRFRPLEKQARKNLRDELEERRKKL